MSELYKNKEWLEQKLKINTVKEICNEINCSEMTIYRWKKKLGIKDNIPNYKNKNWLKQELLFKTAEQIAQENNVSPTTILRYASKFGVNPKQKLYYNEKWLRDTLALYNGSILEISKKYGYKEDTLREWCYRFGIDSTTRKRLYCVNEEYFKNIDTEHKAYWLGFLMADGFVRKDCNAWGICLNSKDKYILEQLKHDIHYSGNISDTKYDNKEQSELFVCSRKMTTYLIYHGIVPKKTGKEVVPQSIPHKYIKDFIRGFMDGDGSINKDCKLRTSCSASINILYSIKKYVENELNGKEYKITVCKKESGNELYYYNIYSDTAMKLANHIYENATIYLKRKYDRYKTKLCAPC